MTYWGKNAAYNSTTSLLPLQINTTLLKKPIEKKNSSNFFTEKKSPKSYSNQLLVLSLNKKSIVCCSRKEFDAFPV